MKRAKAFLDAIHEDHCPTGLLQSSPDDRGGPEVVVRREQLDGVVTAVDGVDGRQWPEEPSFKQTMSFMRLCGVKNT